MSGDRTTSDRSAPPTRTVLVTGASSGIGRATCLALASPEVALVLCARAEEPLEKVAAACQELGARTLVAPADVLDAAAVEQAFQQAQAAFGGVDAVVHSAAVLAYGRFEEVPAEVWNTAVETTLIGAANVAREALRAFRMRGAGQLVVVGSVVGKMAVPWMSSYVAAKWGLHGLVRTLQIEARATPGIGVSLVSPGGVDTPIYRLAGTYVGRHGQPPPPVARPEQVAAQVLRCLERPRRDAGVGAFNPLMVLGFRAFPAIYDRVVSPLMFRLGLADGDVGPTSGNVLFPVHEDRAAAWSRAENS